MEKQAPEKSSYRRTPVLTNSWRSAPSDGNVQHDKSHNTKEGKGLQADLSAIVKTLQQTHGLKLFCFRLENQTILLAEDGWGGESRG